MDWGESTARWQTPSHELEEMATATATALIPTWTWHLSPWQNSCGTVFCQADSQMPACLGRLREPQQLTWCIAGQSISDTDFYYSRQTHRSSALERYLVNSGIVCEPCEYNIVVWLGSCMWIPCVSRQDLEIMGVCAVRSFVGIVREYTLRMSLNFYSSATQSSDLQHIFLQKRPWVHMGV